MSDVKSRLNADISIISAAEISEAAKADAVILYEKTDISNLNEVVDEVKSILAVKEKSLVLFTVNEYFISQLF